MPWILIKNNLKLMLRSKWIFIMMILFPILTIALISNAFQSLMNTNMKVEEFKVGYRLNGDSTYKPLMGKLQDECKGQNIILQDYPEGDIKELLQNRTVDVFVEITNDQYKLYQSNEKKIEASIADSIFSAFFYQVNEEVVVRTYAMKNDQNTSSRGRESIIKQEVLATNPVPSAIDYYGIIYIVYFAWCGMVSLVAVVSSERKSAIPRRMRVTQMSSTNQYLGKFIPCTMAILIEACISWFLSILIYGIHWGNFSLSFVIIVLTTMAASSIGIVLFQLFRNIAISIVTGFLLTWIWGYFGGAFQSYMYLDIPKYLIHSSPVYYINRTLVEYSTSGHSDYTLSCIGYLVSIILVSVLIGIPLTGRSRGE